VEAFPSERYPPCNVDNLRRLADVNSGTLGLGWEVATSMSHERDYVLGTHDAEIARLGLQHRIWRP
jgi:hypothetical protein